MDDKKKMGRPTDSPKQYRISARLNQDEYDLFVDHCKENNLTFSQGLRKAVCLLVKK